MEYLPLPSTGAPHLTVPWVVNQFYDGEEFSSFPRRCGFTDDYATYPADQLASLVQSWLYFGVLQLFFTPFGRSIEPGSFKKASSERAISPHVNNEQVDSRILVGLLDNWLKEVVTPATRPWHMKSPPKPSCGDLFEFRDSFIKFLEEVLLLTDAFDSLPQSSTWPLPAIILSTKILVISLSGVLRELLTYEYGGDDSLSILYSYTPGSVENTFPIGSLGDGHVSPSSRLLLNELQAQGWCPKLGRELCRSQNYAVVYYMSRMTTPQRSSHKECTATCCVGNNVNMKSYETRHTTQECQCTHVLVPIEQVRSIIAAGGVPIVSVQTIKGGTAQLKVAQMTNKTPFNAISHVWADGLGNPHANSLPQCQVERLAEYARQSPPLTWFSKRGLINIGGFQWDLLRMSNTLETPWFWVDTLCIPVGADFEHLRRRAINQMASIYAAAAQVIVVDSGMQRLSYAETPENVCEALAALCASAWITRCWTFQEAGIGSICQVQCSNAGFNPVDLPVGQTHMITSPVHEKTIFRMGLHMLKVAWWLWRTQRHRVPYLGTVLSSTATEPLAALIARPLKHQIMQQFQGVKSSTFTYSGSNSESLYKEFILCWNALGSRTTTMREDIHTILANLLNYSAFTILGLKTPEDRMAALLWSLPAIPFSLFLNTTGPRCRIGEVHNNRWLPLYPNEYLLESEPRVTISPSGTLCLDSEQKHLKPKPGTWTMKPQTTSALVTVLMLDSRIASRGELVVAVEGDENLRLRVHLHRQSGDTLPNSLGNGRSCIVLRSLEASSSNNAHLKPGQSLQGALFQITREVEICKEQAFQSDTAAHTSSSGLQVVFDCPVVVDIQALNFDSHSPAGILSPVERPPLMAQKLAPPWHLDICADPPAVAWPLPRRPTYPPVFPLVAIALPFVSVCNLLDIVAVFPLIAYCAKHFASLSDFSKGAVIAAFTLQGCSPLLQMTVQFRHFLVLLVWNFIFIAPAILYVISRRVDGAHLSGLEYAFVVLSCLCNVCSHAVKVAWKWYFAKEVFKEWQASFLPDWAPEKERGWMKVIFDMKGDLAESNWEYESN